MCVLLEKWEFLEDLVLFWGGLNLFEILVKLRLLWLWTGHVYAWCQLLWTKKGIMALFWDIIVIFFQYSIFSIHSSHSTPQITSTIHQYWEKYNLLTTQIWKMKLRAIQWACECIGLQCIEVLLGSLRVVTVSDFGEIWVLMHVLGAFRYIYR